MKKIKKIIIIGLLGLFAPLLRAEMDIEITEGIESALPIAIVPFAQQGGAVSISNVVSHAEPPPLQPRIRSMPAKIHKPTSSETYVLKQ